MDAASLKFLFFGLAIALLSNLSKSPVWRSAILLVMSIVFIGLIAHSPIVLIPLAGFLLLGFVALKLIERGWSKGLAWSLPVVIFVYIWLKKYTFLPEGMFLHFPYLTLGLSYIFFRILHMLIEAGEGQSQQRIGPISYLLYTLNFTTLVSGPIQRYDLFARDQFTPEPVRLGPRVVGMQLERIIRGFFKVNVLAMLLQLVHAHAIAQLSEPVPQSVKFLAALEVALVYPLFLYANFSGYIDIVIALARLMRLRLPENFDRPFSASSFLDFWNRWHITLSNWLKTYVYNPLLISMMRRVSSISLEPLLGVVCFFVTFFLIGIWHGRTSEFVVFGLLLGGGISINKVWQIGLTRRLGRKRYKALASHALYAAFGRGLTFCFFSFSLFWLWGNWEEIHTIFGALDLAEWLGVWCIALIVATVALAAWEWLRSALLSIKTSEGPVFLSRYARVVYATALCLVTVVMVTVMNQPAPDIVYKKF
jgi:alginate O-acetyltransferase complex protein AlgI